MSENTSSKSDRAGGTYVWYARMAPMYLVLLPIAIGLSVWFPNIQFLERLGAIVISPAILAILLGEKGRDRGRRKQSKLWESWGGPLLTQYLRHRNNDINEHLRLEYHRILQSLLPNLSIPTSDEEVADPEAADKVYDACAQHMVNVAREDPKRFWSAFRENRSYGFRRNLWGLRPLGIIFSLAATLSTALWLVLRWEGAETISFLWLVAILICVGLLALWVFLVTPGWVRLANDAYARRVLESLPKMGERDALGTDDNPSSTT